MTEHNHPDRIFFTGLIVLALILVAALLWPFMTVLLISIAISVVLYPIYQWFNRKVTRNTSWLSSLLTLIIFIIIVIGPLTLIGIAVFHQSQDFYVTLTRDSSVIDKVNIAIAKYVPEGISLDIQERIRELSSTFTASVGAVFTATVTTLFSFLLVVLAVFYFLKDGAAWKDLLVKLSPLPDAKMLLIMEKLRMAMDGVIKGYLVIGLIQGILMGAGLVLFGVPSAALWGLFAAVASLVPTFGTSLIAIPAVLYLFITGHTGAAIGLIIWASLLVGTIDNLLNPIIVGKRIDIHPMLILFSVLGGIVLFGPVGVLAGPLIITFLYTLISLYRQEYMV